MLRNVVVGSLIWAGLLAGCSYGNGADFDEGGAPGPGGAGRGSTSSGGSQPEPETCGDGKKNGAETDVDCGGRCDTSCAVGAVCTTASDCADGNLCTGGTCAAPNATDQAKNGDETDVDCGGQSTGAPRCEVGNGCLAGTDCASGGCDYNGKCVAAPSCVAHFGGDTCGVGEIGSGAEQHEDCCTTLPVQGFSDAAHPGTQVFVDKYEVTAGRMRAFVASVRAQYAGVPNVRQWIADHPPTVWNAGWNQYLPEDEGSDTGINLIFGGYNDEASGFHIHGQNCHLYPATYGAPTWYYPADVLSTIYGSPARHFSQDDLDARAISCVPNAMLAAFCAWDGGQLATAEVLNAITRDGAALPMVGINRSGDSGSTPPYTYPKVPDGEATHDGANRVSPPGRAIPQDPVPGDRTTGPGGQVWSDLAGNMVEQVLVDASNVKSFNVIYEGVGSGSVRAGGNSMRQWSDPNWKSASTGGRCMRFR